MRVVADTNIVVSGLLWRGLPRLVLDAARAGQVNLFTSAVLLDELEDVLSREKFAEKLNAVNVTPHDLVLGYAALALIITPEPIPPTILADLDDDAEVIVSGDSHQLDLKMYKHIHILTAAELLSQVP